MPQINVLFVCTGNTCRSPMAEGLFRQAAQGLDYTVSSAGVAAYPGDSASPETLNVLARKGASLPDFASRPVGEDLLAEATHVFCLTRGHLDILERSFPEFADKYYLAAEFAEIEGEVGKDIRDPIGGGKKAYEQVAEELEAAIEGILGFLAVAKNQ